VDRLEIFKTELDYINDSNIRKFAEKTLQLLPEYFFNIPASTSGRYHPKFSLGDWGLVRHTKVAVRIAFDIINLEMMKYSDIEKDIIITSLLLHDGMKCGENGTGTVLTHPTIMADFIRNNVELNSILDKDIVENIASCISSHMGQWRYDYKDKYKKNPILPEVVKKLPKMVHLCDYLASRRYLSEFDFDIVIPKNK
jgi:23S rRNA maturation-related 3'-5' exoribonuclease YhaM